MAEVNSTSQLIGSMLGRAYNYQEFKDREIARRFCISGSKDTQVNTFRTNVLKAGLVPVEALNFERWKVTRNRVIGNGNQMLQVATMDKMMSQYEKLDPTAQKQLLRGFFAANSRDYDLANRLRGTLKSSPLVRAVNAANKMTPRHCWPDCRSTPAAGHLRGRIHFHDAAQHGFEDSAVGTRRRHGNGIRNSRLEHDGPDRGRSHETVCREQGRDKEAKVKVFGDDLGKLMNLVKAYGQRLQEQQQKQNGNGSDGLRKDLAKTKAMLMQAQTKKQDCHRKPRSKDCPAGNPVPTESQTGRYQASC